MLNPMSGYQKKKRYQVISSQSVDDIEMQTQISEKCNLSLVMVNSNLPSRFICESAQSLTSDLS